jgi:hypothetical protein
MIIENRDDYIKYRMNRAEEAFDDALILAEKGKWNTVINRLYYSCFYSVIALLLKNNIKAKTHNGVHLQFVKNFIKNGLIDKRFEKLYSKLFDNRQKGDYADLFDFDENTAKPLIEPVREFIDEIKKLI